MLAVLPQDGQYQRGWVEEAQPGRHGEISVVEEGEAARRQMGEKAHQGPNLHHGLGEIESSCEPIICKYFNDLISFFVPWDVLFCIVFINAYQLIDRVFYNFVYTIPRAISCILQFEQKWIVN